MTPVLMLLSLSMGLLMLMMLRRCCFRGRPHRGRSAVSLSPHNRWRGGIVMKTGNSVIASAAFTVASPLLDDVDTVNVS